MSRTINFIRSTIFALILVVFTPIWTVLCVFAAPLPYAKRFYITSRWNVVVVWLAKVICGIQYEIKGKENFIDAPAILLCKHQSAWETIFLLCNTPRPLAFVFKKELLYIPFFGWALGLLRMIPIDRKLGIRAFRHVVIEGKKRLENGQWIIMFPEGTRIPVGEQGEYKGGGTRLAQSTKTAIIPIAVNSGECWPKNTFTKIPGKVTVSIGEAIYPEKKHHEALMTEVETWIENEMRVISPHAYQNETTSTPE